MYAYTGSPAYQRAAKLNPRTHGDWKDMTALSIEYGVVVKSKVIEQQQDGTHIVKQDWPTRSAMTVLSQYTLDEIVLFHYSFLDKARDHFDVFIPKNPTKIRPVADKQKYADIWARALSVNVA